MGMVRYACHLGGLTPSDPVDILKVQEISEICGEILYKAPQHKDEQEKKRLREEFAAGKLKTMMSFVDKRIEEAGKKHAILDTVTEADLSLAMVVNLLKVGIFDYVPTDYSDQFPAITRAYTTLMELEPVKAYLASRA
eukprot:TRINITY_DN10895_c0_g2_i1.p3 TRINITY_DN10895_c0_g2~~TRINITY_DN10895_c0_g2_i1.p3  ORF type:complete len:138 (+),score=58.28 TRINITY_DN10895_c0_g2_i1:2348-2761(+)